MKRGRGIRRGTMNKVAFLARVVVVVVVANLFVRPPVVVARDDLQTQ
jgi:hypothetical protein